MSRLTNAELRAAFHAESVINLGVDADQYWRHQFELLMVRDQPGFGCGGACLTPSARDTDDIRATIAVIEAVEDALLAAGQERGQLTRANGTDKRHSRIS